MLELRSRRFRALSFLTENEGEGRSLVRGESQPMGAPFGVLGVAHVE